MPVDRLPNLPAGTDVLLDANVFIYAFSGQAPGAVSDDMKEDQSLRRYPNGNGAGYTDRSADT